MKRANTMSTITVELIIKMKTNFTSSNAENTKWIHLTTDVKFSQLMQASVQPRPTEDLNFFFPSNAV